MENINHKNKSQINTECCYIAISLMVFFIAACAANHNVSQSAISAGEVKQSGNITTNFLEEFELYRNSQLKWLSGLQEGMPQEDALIQVSSYLKYFFQYIEGGKIFQYMEGQYLVTRMQFGLLFEDGRLAGLILDKSVKDFIWYRYNYAREWRHLFQHWLPTGFQESISFIRQENRLGDNYDDVSSNFPQDIVDNGNAAKTTEAVITSLFFAPFAPAVLMVMPFVPEEETTVKSKEIDNITDDKKKDLARELELGVTTEKELVKIIGTPAYKSGKMLSYKSPNTINFGIHDGIIIWSESWFSTKAQ